MARLYLCFRLCAGSLSPNLRCGSWFDPVAQSHMSKLLGRRGRRAAGSWQEGGGGLRTSARRPAALPPHKPAQVGGSEQQRSIHSGLEATSVGPGCWQAHSLGKSPPCCLQLAVMPAVLG